MRTKLTLHLEERLVRRARSYARRTGKSVSEVVAGFFSRLDAPESPPRRELTPAVRRLAGSLAGSSLGQANYRKHMEEKYR
jgi:hypothetical protein